MKSDQLELETHPAVVIPQICRHDAFIADFRVEILVEKIVDAAENSDAPVARNLLRP